MNQGTRPAPDRAAIAIVLGWLILGEVPPALAIIGGVLCIGGVVIARMTRLPLVARLRGEVAVR